MAPRLAAGLRIDTFVMDEERIDEGTPTASGAGQLGLSVAQGVLLKFGLCGLAALVVWGLPWVFVNRPAAPMASLILVIGGVYLGFLMPLPSAQNGLLWRRILGLVYFLVGFFLPWSEQPEAELPWQPYSEALVSEAQAAGKPVMIDFTAAWCGPCRMMESQVFGKQVIVDAAERFVPLRADMTHSSDPKVQALAQQYGIVAYPTVVFLGPDGEERTKLRLVGVEFADRFEQRLAAVR